MKLRPLYDRVVVKRVESATRSKGGLFLPDSAQEKPNEGIVVAVGHGRLADDGSVASLTVAEGDRVLFGKFSGTEIKVGGETRLVLRESDILGIID